MRNHGVLPAAVLYLVVAVTNLWLLTTPLRAGDCTAHCTNPACEDVKCSGEMCRAYTNVGCWSRTTEEGITVFESKKCCQKVGTE